MNINFKVVGLIRVESGLEADALTIRPSELSLVCHPLDR